MTSSHRVRRTNSTCAPNSRTLLHICADPCSQQIIDRFVLKVLRHQVLPTIAEPKPIQDHCDCSCPILTLQRCSPARSSSYSAIPASLKTAATIPNGLVFPFDTPLLVTLFRHSPFFLTLTSNPFFRQPFCGILAQKPFSTSQSQCQWQSWTTMKRSGLNINANCSPKSQTLTRPSQKHKYGESAKSKKSRSYSDRLSKESKPGKNIYKTYPSLKINKVLIFTCETARFRYALSFL